MYSKELEQSGLYGTPGAYIYMYGFIYIYIHTYIHAIVFITVQSL